MYTEDDYARLNSLMREYVDTLNFDRTDAGDGRSGIRFTGFKIVSKIEYDDNANPDNGAVAQWIWYPKVPGVYGIYVNLPEMQYGRFGRGDRFDTGTARVFPAQDAKTISDTKAMIRAGLAKLQELIEAEGA